MKPKSYLRLIFALVAVDLVRIGSDSIGMKSVALAFSTIRICPQSPAKVVSAFPLYGSQNEDDVAAEHSEDEEDGEGGVDEVEKYSALSAAEERRMEMKREAEKEKRRNIGIAVLSFFAACLNYANQMVNPVTELQLLVAMQDNSAPLSVIGHNGKPTVVDFWAPWCDNCKSWAPTLQSVEQDYADKVNFVMVNGDDGKNWPLITRFGVDAIPHLALVSADGDVETALIGPVPKSVLSADLEVLLKNAATLPSTTCSKDQETEEQKMCAQKNKNIQLPYTMFDAFQNRPDLRNVSY